MNGFVSMFKNVQAKDKYIGYFDNKKIKSKVFNHLIKYSDSSQYLFELQRAKKEFEQFLGIKIQDDTSELRVPFEKGCKYIAISYFSSGKDRMLSSKKWAQIINYCIEKTDDKTYFLFLGAKSEKNRLTPLLSKINNKKRCINMAGKLSISMIPFVLKSCDMLLSVESGNVHIAHSIGCKTLCFSGSGAYKRFHPYNDDIVKYIYPDKFQELVDKNSKEIEPIGYLPIPEHLKFSVNEINIDRVKCELDSLFSKTKTCV